MKATLEFNLPEESTDFKIASSAGELLAVIEEIRQAIRSQTKHGDPDKPVSVFCDELREIMLELPHLN